MKTKGKRYPHKLRADGRVKGLALVSLFGWITGERRPPWMSAARTRSKRWIVGTRRVKKIMRKARRS